MCGRYSVYFTKAEHEDMARIVEEAGRRYSDTELHAKMSVGEIRPTNIAPVLVLEGPDLVPSLMKWGFPMWGDKPGVMFNARAETAAVLKSFRDAVAWRRCIIPSTGFYEWTHPAPGAGPKVKYLIRFPDTPVLDMAGLYGEFTDKEGKPYTAFTILTRDANDYIMPIHNRMPLILRTEEERMSWVKDAAAARQMLQEKDNREYILIAA